MPRPVNTGTGGPSRLTRTAGTGPEKVAPRTRRRPAAPNWKRATFDISSEKCRPFGTRGADDVSWFSIAVRDARDSSEVGRSFEVGITLGTAAFTIGASAPRCATTVSYRFAARNARR